MFNNAIYDETLLDGADLFVCAIGYEARSYYLFDRIKDRVECSNILLFVMDDYGKYEDTYKKVEEVKANNYTVDVVKYQDGHYVTSRILNAISNRILPTSNLSVHIDYSSMPRGWYARLPILLQGILREQDKVYFWYSEGNYPSRYEEYPTAGIESINHFSGKSSMKIRKRTHIIGIGYDIVRTQGITSVLDPECIVACEAHDPTRQDIFDNVVEANEQILAQAQIRVFLDLSDFVFMISKLREITNELVMEADVVLVPDGPKPLIFAMSLIPDLIDRKGITCLHVVRNKDQFKPVNVVPSGKVIGFLTTKG